MGEVRILDREPDPSDPREPRGRSVLLIGIGVLIGAVAVSVFTNTDASSGDGSSTSVPLAATTAIPDEVSSTSTVTTSTVSTTVDGPVARIGPTVAARTDAVALLGSVALTPSPDRVGTRTMWVLRPGGSVVHRGAVPLAPGDFPYPLLMTGGHIGFVDLEYGYLIDSDLIDRPQQLTEASFIVPSATPGQVWFVGRGAEWVAPVDITTQTVGDRIDVTDVFEWPMASAADGLLVTPVDEAAYGPIAYWSPTEGLEPIALDNPDHSRLLAAAGSVAVLLEGDLVKVIDTATGDQVGRPGAAVGDGLNIEACLSPDQRYVAVVGATGDAYIMEVDSGVVHHRFSDVGFGHSIGWTAPDQFVYVADSSSGTTVRAIDISTGQVHVAADLIGSRAHWWLTASGTMC